MNRFYYGLTCAVFISLSMGVGRLQAQPVPGIGPAGPSPVYSPYLNMLRNNNNSSSPTLNYFALVQPQVQTNQALMNLANGVNQNQQSIGDLSGNAITATGHPTQFLNLGGYFLNSGGSGGGGTLQSAGAVRAVGAGTPPVGAGASAPQR